MTDKKKPTAPVTLPDEDIWSINIINSSIRDAQGELSRRVSALNAIISSLEIKHKVKFDSTTGQFFKIEESKEKPKDEVSK